MTWLLVLIPVLLLALAALLSAGVFLVQRALKGRRACLQEDTFEVAAEASQVFDRSRAVLSLLSAGGSVERAEEGAGVIEARLATSWRSWGERIALEISHLGPQRARVKVSSWSALPTTLVDYGKNAENLLRFRSALQESLLSATRAPGVGVKRAAEAPPVAVVTPRAGEGRCPYCRDTVALSEAVACAGCGAKHHAPCWDEHRQCATCGSRARFAAVEFTEGREQLPGGERHKA